MEVFSNLVYTTGWYSYFIMSENIISFFLSTMIYLSYVTLTTQLSQFVE